MQGITTVGFAATTLSPLARRRSPLSQCGRGVVCRPYFGVNMSSRSRINSDSAGRVFVVGSR